LSFIDRVIYAPNVHQGGGKTLLLPLLGVLKDDKHTLFILDERLQIPDSFNSYENVVLVRPTLVSRFMMEYFLWRGVEVKTDILCLGNLPPLWVRKSNIVVFVQNRYLVEKVPLSGFSLFAQMRIQFERRWLRARSFCVTKFIVQTPTMKHLLQNLLWRDADILSYAVFVEGRGLSGEISGKQYDYLYIASGEPHKNHRCLIEAWVIMAKKGKFPSLCLTLQAEKSPDLCLWIEIQCQQYGLKIEMVEELSFQEIQDLYCNSKVLIYPSTLESFGLPLLEAVYQGLSVIASDLSYVHDVIKPNATFNPESSESIANAVMNADTSKPTEIILKLVSVETFIADALSRF
jgi:glycosyltransferase involved in cell wall biosynthesis